MENAFIEETKELLLDKYQIRKSRKQKTRFIRYTGRIAERMGYKVSVEGAESLIGSRNIVIGDLDKAKVVLSAHYDTCAISFVPNRIFVKSKPLFWAYQLYMLVVFVAIAFAGTLLAALLGAPTEYASYIFDGFIVLILLQLLFGITNRHTANDNTSGVLTLFTLMESLKNRTDVAFVFFDNEEKGLLGSAKFKNAHADAMKQKLLINFDCVGEGEHLFFLCHKAVPESVLADLKKAQTTEEIVVHAERSSRFVYSSDQVWFARGIAVTAVHKCKLGGYTVGKIHTAKDRVLNTSNIRAIRDIIADLLDNPNVSL